MKREYVWILVAVLIVLIASLAPTGSAGKG